MKQPKYFWTLQMETVARNLYKKNLDHLSRSKSLKIELLTMQNELYRNITASELLDSLNNQLDAIILHPKANPSQPSKSNKISSSSSFLLASLLLFPRQFYSTFFFFKYLFPHEKICIKEMEKRIIKCHNQSINCWILL